MKKAIRRVSLRGLLVLALLVASPAVLPLVGLPYGPLDWTVYSQAYVEPPPNLALGRPAYSSTALEGHEPSLAVDGDANTTWESFRTGIQWWYVRLDYPQWVNQIVVHWGQNYASAFRVSVLTGRYWQPVYETYAGDGEEDVINFPPIYGEAGLVSFIYPVPGAPSYSLSEVEVYLQSLAALGALNLALGHPAVASSFQPGHEPGLVTDADLSTEWWSDPVVDPVSASIFVDLGAPYPVEQATLIWGENYATTYRLYGWVFVWIHTWYGWYGYWTWWPLYNGIGQGGQDIAFFSPIYAQYIRLVADNRADLNQGYQLKEFELYSREIGIPPGGPPGYGFVSPGEARSRLGETLNDVVPPGWEASPAWRLMPSEKGLSVPRMVSPGRGPRLQR